MPVTKRRTIRYLSIIGTALKVITNEIELDILRLRDLGILKEVAEKRFELDLKFEMLSRA
ncbi:hypothetical protein NHP21005_13250 [Helicobacter sp. NHP21005]|uniref:hypothetical protein n=1 Tax=Helicobacter felistomachi TaxID=3040201 RepID=UPI002572A916|nr:hypothetical protein [Helicobacter sp. NHP21005]BEG57637.1 hypothetical protein NHP21005_13250 [Helicobacter sp. NHP21005]